MLRRGGNDWLEVAVTNTAWNTNHVTVEKVSVLVAAGQLTSNWTVERGCFLGAGWGRRFWHDFTSMLAMCHVVFSGSNHAVLSMGVKECQH